MSKWQHLLRKRITYLLMTLGLAGVLTAQHVSSLAADPAAPKDCPPLTPTEAGGEGKATTIQMSDPFGTLPWSQRGGTINDASCLNRTPIYGIVKVRTTEEIGEALSFARERGLKVSMAGVKHSMGGQAFFANALVLDMTGFNRITLDEAKGTVTVQSGATWHEIQNVIHPKYAVKAMQSTDIFTVGGSVSVNAHGMDHHAGALGKSIRRMTVMLADGRVETLTPTTNRELWDLVIGGYGLFGVILEVELEVLPNEIYDYHAQVIRTEAFPELFNAEINDARYGLFYGHLSTAPSSYLDEMLIYTYKRVEGFEGEIPPLSEVATVKLRRFVLNFSKSGRVAKEIKWFAEKNEHRVVSSCTLVNRNQAMTEGEACLVSRNEPMHDSVHYLQNNLPHETDILQEYYLPRDQLLLFIEGMREVLRANNANLLNASVRVVHQEDNFLTYAPTDMFAIVLYLNQPVSAQGTSGMRALTSDLIDLTVRHNGRFFLPYQLHYTAEQLEGSYPEIRDFFAAKRRHDPQGIFTNTFYEKYAPQLQ